MFNWIDILIATWILYCVVVGLRAGLVSTLFDFFGLIIAVITAKLYYNPISSWLETHVKMYAELRSRIFADLLKTTGSTDATTNGISHATSGFVFPTNLENMFLKTINRANGAQPMEAQSQNFAEFVMGMSTFIMVLVGLLIVLGIVKLILNQFAKLPLIKEVNHLSGGIIGLAKGLISISIIMAVIIFISPMLSKTGLINSIEGSYLGQIFYNNNVIIYLLSWLQR